jgi:hypothetical protein
MTAAALAGELKLPLLGVLYDGLIGKLIRKGCSICSGPEVKALIRRTGQTDVSGVFLTMGCSKTIMQM